MRAWSGLRKDNCVFIVKKNMRAGPGKSQLCIASGLFYWVHITCRMDAYAKQQLDNILFWYHNYVYVHRRGSGQLACRKKMPNSKPCGNRGLSTPGPTR